MSNTIGPVTPDGATITDALAPTFASSGDSPARISAIQPSAGASMGTHDPRERYESVTVLGRGGMGEVRLWKDRRVGRELAVKVAHASLGDDGRLRFAREALLQARLEHPSFVPVYDIATDAAGELFFTMRKVRGRTLRELLEAEAKGGEPMPRHRLLAVFTQLCLAIDYAHSRGVVHRDVKPDNVMLGDFGEVYLLDWGIAKIVDESETNAVPLRESHERPQNATAHGSMLGTPGYMAPEQIRGENATLDGRADVYALGAVLFEILAGVPMIERGSFADMVVATLEPGDHTPSQRSPSRDVAPELDAIVVRATEFDRGARYSSARELANAIERYLEGDRDLASRRARAHELATDAERSLAAAAGDPEKRAEAGRVAARSLAFDPEEKNARRVLLAVLGEEVVNPPSEVVTEVDRGRAKSQSATLVGYAMSSLAIKAALFAMTCVFAWRGAVTNYGVLVGALVMGVISALITLREARRPNPSEQMVTLGFVFTAIENVMYTRICSPLVSIPLSSLAAALGVAMHAPPNRRMERIWLSIASFVLPFVLEASGAISPTWIAGPTEIRIVSRLTTFPPPGWFFIIHGAFIVFAVAQSLFPTLDAARRAELRSQSASWMLRRVLGT